MKFKMFFRGIFQFLKAHPKFYIFASVIILVPAIAITSVVIVRSAKKKPVKVTIKDVVSAPIVSYELTEEPEKEEEKPETNIEYNGKTIVVPKKVVAKINSKEDPVNTVKPIEQPKVQPKSQNDIKTDTFAEIAYGIDVSSHNGDIDWKKVKASGVEFVMIRCGYRGYETGKIVVDAKFEKNISNAYKNGIRVG
ncbi:MAG: hypothetical protein MJ080_05475, partial [Clostridia bacterium]|nr:hypothetical protein [Clostridia bacterium]